MHCVVAHRHVEVACILVEYGADATAAMGPGRLHCTEPRLGGTRQLRMFVNTEFQDKGRRTPLYLASKMKP